MRFRVVTVLCLLFSVAHACMNDRDTDRFEFANQPDEQRALTGRFDRYPPLYYQMRVDRLRPKKDLSPDEMDDMAVALGRLGRNDDGLAVLSEKAKLAKLSNRDRYRLFANRGTLRAHKWIADGAKASELPLLESAEQDIKTAMELNPKAHFGREGVQRSAIHWLILNVKEPQKAQTLGFWMSEHPIDKFQARSLSGLIMLGGAWESPDVALAIAHLAHRRSQALTQWIALLRYKELIQAGKRSMAPERSDQMAHEIERELIRAHPSQRTYAEETYKGLRAEADKWLEHKTSYASERLKKGLHPDTDQKFWDGWHEPAMPKVKALPREKFSHESRFGPGIRVVTGLLVLLIAGGAVFHYRRKGAS